MQKFDPQRAYLIAPLYCSATKSRNVSTFPVLKSALCPTSSNPTYASQLRHGFLPWSYCLDLPLTSNTWAQSPPWFLFRIYWDEIPIFLMPNSLASKRLVQDTTSAYTMKAHFLLYLSLILFEFQLFTEARPVYRECGCDDNTGSAFMNDLLRDGSYSALNRSLVTVAIANNTSTIVINGTLPNGTTASGGSISANAGGSLRYGSAESLGSLLIVTALAALAISWVVEFCIVVRTFWLHKTHRALWYRSILTLIISWNKPHWWTILSHLHTRI